MAIYVIENQFGEQIGRCNSAESEAQAIDQFVKESCKPIYCRLHDEMPEDRRSGKPGEMGYYQPAMPKPAKAILMKEVYMGGGYCIIPA